MSYLAFAICLIGLALWYGEDAMPVIGTAALITLYLMVTELEWQKVQAPAALPTYQQHRPLPLLRA